MTHSRNLPLISCRSTCCTVSSHELFCSRRHSNLMEHNNGNNFVMGRMGGLYSNAAGKLAGVVDSGCTIHLAVFSSDLLCLLSVVVLLGSYGHPRVYRGRRWTERVVLWMEVDGVRCERRGIGSTRPYRWQSRTGESARYRRSMGGWSCSTSTHERPDYPTWTRTSVTVLLSQLHLC